MTKLGAKALETPDGNAELLALILATAREAAALVLTGYRKHRVAGDVLHKGPVDLVTRFDFESEALLRARLAEGSSIPVVGEERGGAAGGAGEAVFYVDPIDGTTNFVHGHPFYCVSIGIVAAGAPQLGAVVAPSLDLAFSGGSAVGSARRERAFATPDATPDEAELCRVSSVDRFGDALLATGFPYDRATHPDNNFESFVAVKKRCQAVRRCGSAALDLCFVADGTYDGYWERRLKPWDLAGGAAIVLAAGGLVTAFDGGAADLGEGSVVATNGHIHEALLRELSGLR